MKIETKHIVEMTEDELKILSLVVGKITPKFLHSCGLDEDEQLAFMNVREEIVKI